MKITRWSNTGFGSGFYLEFGRVTVAWTTYEGNINLSISRIRRSTMASSLNEQRYARNWIEKHGPQTRPGLVTGFRETFASDLATQAVDNLFRDEYLIADDDGMIHWAETYRGRPTNAEAAQDAQEPAGQDSTR